MKVLVTGSAGFLGRHVQKALLSASHEVVALDTCHGSDIRRSEDVHQLSVGCTHVIHLAGVLGTAELFDEPHLAVRVNVQGTLNVLQACARLGLGYVGITMPQCWDNVYQATKNCARSLAAAWHRHEGVPVAHVRAFNAYGAGQKVRPVQKIIPTFATSGWSGGMLPVWGDGSQQVDLVWAGDIARMLVQALEFGDDEVFDAGTGTGVSVLEIANYVIQRTGGTAKVQFLPMRKGEHEAKVVATGEGWELMDWRPPVRPQELDRAILWYRDRRD